jgi:hypothetical protein
LQGFAYGFGGFFAKYPINSSARVFRVHYFHDTGGEASFVAGSGSILIGDGCLTP